MPKATKKKKDKAADFRKAKLKLGKGKQLASNAIDTSFKARSIALPSQARITQSSSDAVPRTKRNLSLADLLSQARHYSAATRKDALFGLRELFDSNPDILLPSLPLLISTCTKLIADDDSSVRKTLHSVFKWLLPRIPEENLIPYSSNLLLFTTAAQTHIFPEIRVDAVRFLDILLEAIPSAVVSGWEEANQHGSRVLEGYMGILSAGTVSGEHDGPIQATSTASVVLSLSSRAVVLQSLSTFLSHVRAFSFSGRTGIWYMRTLFARQEAFEAFQRLILPSDEQAVSTRSWQETVDDEESEYFVQSEATHSDEGCWSLEEISRCLGVGYAAGDVSSSASLSFVKRLARRLHPTLIAAILDTLPTITSPNTHTAPENETNLRVAAVTIAATLYGIIFQGTANDESSKDSLEDLVSIIGYLAPYFPLGNDHHQDNKAEKSFRDLNILYCSLVSYHILSSSNSSSQISTVKAKQNKNRSSAKPSSKLDTQTRFVSQYVLHILQSGRSSMERSLAPPSYASVLPTIWALLSLSHPEPSHELFRAVVEHATGLQSNSPLKASATELLCFVVLLDTEDEKRFVHRLVRDPASAALLLEWVEHLPKVLWEIGNKNMDLTEMILRFFLRAHQRHSSLVSSKSTLSSIRSRLSPYFSINHASRGRIDGPFAKLPSTNVRRLALGVAVLLWSVRVQPDDAEREAFEENVRCAVASTGDDRYWTQIQRAFRR